MLKKLTYSVTFPSTGRTLSETVHFKGGFGAIVGRNESGKSMVIEMTRFCLFGSAALRGTTDQYQAFKSELDFVLRNEDYKIKRTATTAKILRDGEEIAVGIRPTNEKVVQLLGFGLDVFDMACVANQDELTRLGTMRPTERKRMVDSVIGLGVLDDLAKSAGDEALSFTRRADDLLDVVREPIEPTQPAGYRPSKEIDDEHKALMKLQSEYDQLKGWLSCEMKEPDAPEEKVALPSTELQTLVDQQDELKAQRRVLELELKGLPEPTYTGDQLDEFQDQAERHSLAKQKQRFLNQYEEPEYDDAMLNAMELQWKAHYEYTQAKAQLAALQDQGEHVCPACDHHWPVAGEAVSEAERRLAGLYETIAPQLTLAEIKRHRAIIEAWESVDTDWLDGVDENTPPPMLSSGQIEAHRKALGSQDKRKELEDLTATLEKQPDYSKMLSDRKVYEHQIQAYQKAVVAYEAWQQEKASKLVRAKFLEVELEQLTELEELYRSCMTYEQALESYKQALTCFQDAHDQAATWKVHAQEWKKVKVALTALRAMIKQHLVPSLNLVASHLVDQMTGGERTKIVCDEDFNILVDDQPIDTLSGSGKAVANLALRLGLGQVLTNNVCSLFMGDEIDASMDKDRAENTANTLQTLRRKISQILLVTHKYPLADYYIELGKNSDRQTQESEFAHP